MSNSPTFGEAARLIDRNGYIPIPILPGRKNPAIDNWSSYSYTPSDDSEYANAGIGILTGESIGIDIDVPHEDLAERVSEIVRKQLGASPVRFGKFPKRLHVARTDTPFAKKKTRVYDVPGAAGPCQVEVLAKGQQFVAFGIHPDTKKPYTWNGAGDPCTVSIDMLPAVTEQQIEALLTEIEDLLSEYGEAISHERPKAEGRQHTGGALAAVALIANVLLGAELHDSLRDLAAHYAAQGLSFTQGCELLQGTMQASLVERDDRWKARYEDIPRLVHSALEKFKRVDSEPFTIAAHSAFVRELLAPKWIVLRVLQRGYLYALTAYWGHGKTAIMLTFALSLAAGRKVGTLDVDRCKVIFLCGENVDDVRLRVRAVVDVLGITDSELEGWIYFTQAPFAIENAESRERFVAAAAEHGPFGLAVIDTGPAHSEAEEENANRQMHDLAVGMRALAREIGNPCVVALMHPAKGATKESMQPRGGGAFSGAIDGELAAWKDDGSPIVELFHRAKFRGPGFAPLAFELKPYTVPGLLDNFGQPACTVVAVPIEERDRDRAAQENWNEQNRVLYAMYTTPRGSLADWARECSWISGNGDPEKWRVQRILKALVAAKLVERDRAGRYTLNEKGRKEAEKAGRI